MGLAIDERRDYVRMLVERIESESRVDDRGRKRHP
jgi:hypothetical protein